MINIISRAYYSRVVSGPKKVVDNLIKGLELINYPFAVNKRLDACQRLWIHDDIAALWQIKNLPPEIKVLIGPNLFVKPAQVPAAMDLSRAVYIQPSQWAADFWKTFGFNSCPLQSWPGGIDTREFTAATGAKKYILVYFKQRGAAELEFVERELKQRNLAYKFLNYPNYSQKEYKKLLSQSRYVIWLGRQESQGIALEEALACNVPAIVCDVSSLGHWDAPKKEMAQFNAAENAYAKATSAEYFSADCGIKLKKLADLPAAIEEMEQVLLTYHPREFILKNLSLEKQARDFVEIYHKYFGLSFEQGLNERVLRTGDWQNNSAVFRLKFFARDRAKWAYKFLTSLK